MTDKFELEKNFESYCLILATTSVSDSLETLRKNKLTFAVVGDINHPQTLITEEHLLNFAGEVSIPVSDFLEDLPPLVVVDGDVNVLEKEDIVDLAIILQKTKSPGLVIYKDNKVTGVISKNAIKRALSPADFALAKPRLYGNSNVPIRTYICRKCIPPMRLRPRQGNMTPDCPLNWLHGPMERDE